LITLAMPLLIAADRPNTAKLNDPSLREITTRHYQIHTDLDEPLVTDLSTRMDLMYDQYVKTFPQFALPASPAPLPVYLFATHEKYMAFTDYSGVNTGGLFVSGRHPYLTAYLKGQGRDALRRALQHEAFHQFAHAAIARQLPPWLNEGMAQMFEESIFDGNEFLTGQIPPLRIRQLQADMTQKTLVEFDQFLNLSPRQWSSTLHSDFQKAATAYNQAWAMAYFCSADGEPAYHAKFVDLLQKLHTDDSQPDFSTRKCFADLKEFRRRFDAWAAKLQPTPEATRIEHQNMLADFLLAIQQNKLPMPADMAAFRNMAVRCNIRIRYTRGNLTFTSDDRPAVYFSDSAGNEFKPEDLFFQADADAPLPDIVCRAGDRTYRAKFYTEAGKTEHEVLVEGSPLSTTPH
jgi:hypothetical protein